MATSNSKAKPRLVVETDRDTFLSTGELVLAAVEGSGEYREILDSETLRVVDLPENIQLQLMYSGVSGVIGQRTSEVQGAREKLQYLRDRELVQWPAGNWAAKRSSAGGGPVPLWIRAVARVKGCSESAAAKEAEKMSQEDREKIKNHPKVLEAIEEIKKESGEQSGPDFSDLLGEEDLDES